MHPSNEDSEARRRRVEDNERNRNHHRDLCLVLFGYALAKGEPRQQILDAIGSEDLPGDIGPLLTSLSGTDNGPIKRWFEDRDAAITDGATPIQAAIDSILRRNKRQLMKSISTELQFARLEDTEELVKRMRRLADELESKK